MGLTCSLHRASEAEITRLLAEPDAMAGFLYPEDGSTPRVREVRPKGVLGWLLRLTPITIEEVVPDSGDGPEPAPLDPDRTIDIDKAWHGLHFLLTGTADEGDEPACFLVRRVRGPRRRGPGTGTPTPSSSSLRGISQCTNACRAWPPL